jgi:hypothetical protein
MIFQWTPEFIEEMMQSLDPKEQSALHCYLSLKDNDIQPGKIRLDNFKLDSIEEYEYNLAGAINSAKLYFHQRGIHKVEDLDFPEQNKTCEGRLQCKGDGRPTKAMAVAV